MLTYPIDAPRSVAFTNVVPHDRGGDDPTLGLVIGTHGSPGYVELQLEAMCRFNPGVPVLVVDDGSDRGERLLEVCRCYGAEFIANPSQHGHSLGDLTVFLHGLQWAKRKGFDLLAKFSRRWLVLKPWAAAFRSWTRIAGHHTYSGSCHHYGFGFRTECMGMRAADWWHHCQDLRATIQRGQSVFVESYLHQLAQRTPTDQKAKQLEGSDPGYLHWEAMFHTRSRHENPDGIMWHDCTPRQRYMEQASSWGLDVRSEDF